MRMLTEELISSIKLRSFVPISQKTFEESDLIQVINEEMSIKVVPAIMSVREDYYLTHEYTALTADLERYSTPKRAVGNALKSLWYADSARKRQYELDRCLVSGMSVNSGSSQAPRKFLLEGDEIVVQPKPASGANGYLEQWYFRRPNKMIATASCAKITDVNSAGGTTTFTVDTDLTGSLSVGSKLDILCGDSPFLLWAQEVAITAITTTTIAVATSAVINDVSAVEPQINDYLCPTGYTNIPMMPEEWHPVLAQVSAIRILKSIGDNGKADRLALELRDEILPNCYKMIQNRVETSAAPVVPKYGILDAMGHLGVGAARSG